MKARRKLRNGYRQSIPQGSVHYKEQNISSNLNSVYVLSNNSKSRLGLHILKL